MRTLAAAILLVAASALVSASAGAGDLDLAKSRYEEAAYEDALKILDGVEPSTAGERVQVEQYRALCHIALGHAEQAERAVIALVDADPTYLPPTTIASPKVLAMVAETRRRHIPDRGQKAARQRPRRVCREEHGAGGRAVLAAPEAARRARDGGSPGACRLPHAGAGLRSARFGAAGTAAPRRRPSTAAPPRAPPRRARAAAAAPRPAAPRRSRLPCRCRKRFRMWRPPNQTIARNEYTGSLKLQIGADGRVKSATMVKPSHPAVRRGAARDCQDVALQASHAGRRQHRIRAHHRHPAAADLVAALRPALEVLTPQNFYI